MTIAYHVGDTREVVATIPDGSVSLVACSPPFIALRSYLPADHPLKHAEIGSEPDPATFLDTLLQLTAEWGRVLAPWGSIAIELGDTYAGSGGAGGDYNPGGLREGQEAFAGSAYIARQDTKMPKVASDCATGGGITNLHGKVQPGGANWPRPKCLALVPQLYAASLAYGRNILTGAESPAGQWLVRNMIVWHRPNPPVGALGDKYRPSTSYITVATRSAKRWFDLTAVRGPANPVNERGTCAADGQSERFTLRTATGAPPLDAWFDEHDTWTITTQPSSLAHYAMWPPKLAERLILSMCPAEVCAVCGEPRRRVESEPTYIDGAGRIAEAKVWPSAIATRGAHSAKTDGNVTRTTRTTGWTDCGHGAFVPGTVLDPFAGTGTTLAVADCHGRDAIGIDIDERNRDMVDARMPEVRRALFGVKPEMPGQLDIFATKEDTQ